VVEPVMSIVWPDARSAAVLLVTHGVVLAALLCAPVVLVAFVAVATRWSRRSLLVVVLAYGAVAVWFVDVLVNQTVQLAFGEDGFRLLGSTRWVRYALVPSMFVVALVLLGADRLLSSEPFRRTSRPARRTPHRGWRVLTSAVGAALVVVVAVVFAVRFVPASTGRSDGPEWQASVAHVTVLCRTQRPGHRANIAAAPTGWAVVLACKDIDGGARFP
jgi:hypothetical protein